MGVAVGVDAHKSTLAAVAVDELGRTLSAKEFRNDRDGHMSLLRWLRELGGQPRVGIESSGRYGALGDRGCEAHPLGRCPQEHRSGMRGDLTSCRGNLEAARRAGYLHLRDASYWGRVLPSTSPSSLIRRLSLWFSAWEGAVYRGFSVASGHLDATGRDRADDVVSPSEDERAAVSYAAGYRFVTLDSLVPGKGYGWISNRQLEWLRGVLSHASTKGTILVFHHPPIALNVEIQHALRLQNSPDLADAVRETDVQLMLCGHFHQQIFG